jgi:transcriptional regulator with XRE-family HTH domain
LQIRHEIARLQLKYASTTLESQLLFCNFKNEGQVEENKGFDNEAFYRALETVVQLRRKTWKQVAQDTGVSASTLTRMSQGRSPDAASMAALSAWAGINPSDFVTASYKRKRPEALPQIAALLRSDPNLDGPSAEAVEAIVRAAYERMKKD